jgi:hypothetical protein
MKPRHQLALNPDTRAGCRGGKYVIHLDVVWDIRRAVLRSCPHRNQSLRSTAEKNLLTGRLWAAVGQRVCSCAYLSMLMWKLVCFNFQIHQYGPSISLGP